MRSGLRPVVLIGLIAITASTASAARSVVTGNVAAARSRWSAGDVVTDVTVRRPDGELTTVVQLGGVVDGIGMTFSHQPAIANVGDEVELEVGDGAPALVRRVQPLVSFASVAGAATYGIQRTKLSKLPLWRDSGCIDMIYDSTTIPEPIARVLDTSFATWSTATTQCGGVSFVSGREANAPTARDGINTVHIRHDRWCRPANATEPELCYEPSAAAVTRLIFFDSPGTPEDGKIIEADMDLNAVNFALLLPGSLPPAGVTALDLQTVVTHEVGHVLGLAHNCGTGQESWPTDETGQAVPACAGLAPDSSIVAATMYYQVGPGDTRGQTLEPSDIAGACTLARELTCERFVEGGCSANGSGSGGGGALALLSLLGVLVLRRRR